MGRFRACPAQQWQKAAAMDANESSLAALAFSLRPPNFESSGTSGIPAEPRLHLTAQNLQFTDLDPPSNLTAQHIHDGVKYRHRSRLPFHNLLQLPQPGTAITLSPISPISSSRSPSKSRISTASYAARSPCTAEHPLHTAEPASETRSPHPAIYPHPRRPSESAKHSLRKNVTTA
jgi:hypothetical protein